jgi:uncharacterized membrane protein
MTDLIVVSFDNLDDAKAAMADLRRIEREGLVKFEDSAIVERGQDGQVHVKNELSGATETGAAVGALIGGVVTFFFPVVGIAVGGAVGGAIGALMHSGVEGSFVDVVKEQLSVGKSALFLAVKSGTSGVITALRPYSGEVIQTTLEGEAEEALKDAMKA